MLGSIFLSGPRTLPAISHLPVRTQTPTSHHSSSCPRTQNPTSHHSTSCPDPEPSLLAMTHLPVQTQNPTGHHSSSCLDPAPCRPSLIFLSGPRTLPAGHHSTSCPRTQNPASHHSTSCPDPEPCRPAGGSPALGGGVGTIVSLAVPFAHWPAKEDHFLRPPPWNSPPPSRQRPKAGWASFCR